MKACSTCREAKPLDEFPPDKRTKDGLHSQCRPCRREVLRRYRERNPTVNRDYYLQNRERILAREKAQREGDPEGAREKSERNRRLHGHKWKDAKRRWREENSERAKAQIRAWHAAHPERIKELRRESQARRRARKMKLPCEDVVIAVVFERDAGVCGICGQPVDPDDWHLDHIIPLAAGGSHTYENVQVAHPRCNGSKGARVLT